MQPAFTGTSEQASTLAAVHWRAVAAILAEEPE
jgi:hypothetical protein